jgi:hypothetical protein
MADRSRSRSRSPDRGAPPTDHPPTDQPPAEAPPAANDAVASAPDEEVKLYVGNLDYGKNFSKLIFPLVLAAVTSVSPRSFSQQPPTKPVSEKNSLNSEPSQRYFCLPNVEHLALVVSDSLP